MNDLNQLEKELQSWIPRHPSAGLKARLFHPAPASALAPSPVAIMPLWFKFAPVACLFLLITLFCLPRPERTGYLAVSGSSNILASLSSNLLASCATDLRSQRQNVWREVTFEWTKDRHSLSTTGSFPPGKTNIQKL
jgi:hypothetical protein